MELRPWFEREFPVGLTPDVFPGVVERLRGTPARVRDRVQGLDLDVLTTRYAGRWSIQDHIGHLWDLEIIWAGRLDDVLMGLDDLRPRDLTNGLSDRAGHNARLMSELLRMFRTARAALVKRLERLPERVLRYETEHPRLKRTVNVVDIFSMVADHDDHHLARISQIVRRTVRPRIG